MQMRGRVVRRLQGRGSKSEHEALMLETAGGAFRLRRAEGNPFHDPELDDLEGHEITCEGVVEGTTLLLTAWKVVG
jgi:hypothetical protein